MTASIALLALAGLLGKQGSRQLDRAEWPSRSPALGIAAWLTLMSAIFLSLFLATATLVTHKFPGDLSIASVLHSCSAFVIEHGQRRAESVWTGIGVAGSFILVGCLTVIVVVTRHRQRRAASRQLDLLQVICKPHAEPDVLVLRHDSPSAYCLAGRRKHVIVTDGALHALTDTQWQQVLAHERAHLTHHHHAWVRFASAFHTLFRGRFGSAAAQSRIGELVEMHADDAADFDRRWDLAVAVLVLGVAPSPAGALAAGGGAAARVLRLTRAPTPLSARARGLVVAMTAAMWAAPVLVTFTPGTLLLLIDYCPSLLGGV